MVAPFFLLLAGARCQTSDPSCSADTADGGADDGELTCAAGQVAVCQDRCVDLGDEGDSCKVDPCNTQHVCRDGLTCVDELCEPTASLALLECDPDVLLGEEGFCSSGTYCVPFGQDCNVTTPQHLAGLGADGMCSVSRHEGEPCDSEWSDLDEPLPPNVSPRCLPCGPGLLCDPAPGHPSILICQRGCDSNADCPCDSGCEAGRCKVPCVANGLRCEPNGLTCCDEDSDCAQVVIPALGMSSNIVNVCCHAGQDAECDSQDDCCPGSVCTAGTCEPCGAYPGAPVPKSGICCGDLVPRTRADSTTFCGLPCPLTEAGADCADAVGPCGQGVRYSCDPVAGDVCVTGDPRDVGDECVQLALTEQCGTMIAGELACKDGELECVAPIDTCFGPGVLNGCGGGNPDPCWTLASGGTLDGCNNDHECAPGYVCTTEDLGEEIEEVHYCRRCDNDPAGSHPTCWPNDMRSNGCRFTPDPIVCSP